MLQWITQNAPAVEFYLFYSSAELHVGADLIL